MATRKTKMISIRVSESEYELLKSRYASLGSRSISHFAREALQFVLGNSTRDDLVAPPHMEVRQLTKKLASLQSQVSTLTRLVSERGLDSPKE